MGKLRKEDLLSERIKSYGRSGIYPFHMPGHKRCRNQFTEEFPNPYGIDITEIEGFDNLHHPEGILRKSMDWAAELYGSDRTYYLINGSSCGILSAIGAVSGSYDKIIISRNCHKSVYHGVILKNLKTVYIYPQIIEKLWITGGISVEDVEKVLEDNPDACAVLLVSPTYDGIVSDIRGIAEKVHQRGIPLIVDEAHGAHFSFDREEQERLFPVSALECGADVVIQSLHKTLPSFTQTAVLHVRKGYVDIDRLEWYLQVYQSSSPSYLLLSGIERCIFEMNEKGREHYQKFDKKIHWLREELSNMNCLSLLGEAVIGNYGVYDIDCSKLVISCRDSFLSGKDLAKRLREKYGLEMEMCGADYVVAITTFSDTEEGLRRLRDAFLEIDHWLIQENLGKGDGSFLKKEESEDRLFPDGRKGTLFQNCYAEIAMTLAEAREKRWERIRIKDCAGRISTEFVYLYPPGIPIVAPGERMNQNLIDQIDRYKKMGLPVQGMEDSEAEYLRVCEKESEKISDNDRSRDDEG